jgi:hypothetical protein
MNSEQRIINNCHLSPPSGDGGLGFSSPPLGVGGLVLFLFAKVSLKNEQRMWVPHRSAGIAVQKETLRGNGEEAFNSFHASFYFKSFSRELMDKK